MLPSLPPVVAAVSTGPIDPANPADPVNPMVEPKVALRTLGVEVLGVRVTPATPELAADEIERWIADDVHSYVCVTGVHGVMESAGDPALRTIHNEAGMVVPDGMPMVWASHRVGLDWVSRCYGPDLMLLMCERAVTHDLSFYFYGGKEGTPEELRDRLVERFPGLRVVGLHSPPFRALTDDEDEAIVAEINSSGADIVWVGLSTPKQERWMAAHAGRVNSVMIGVGAAFDFHAGNVTQAPSWMQQRGLEWLYRLIQEPRRLYRRYVIGIPKFLAKVARERPRLVAHDPLHTHRTTKPASKQETPQ